MVCHIVFSDILVREVRYSLVNTLIFSDWLLPVDIGQFLLSEPVNIFVSLCIIPFVGIVSTFDPLSAHNSLHMNNFDQIIYNKYKVNPTNNITRTRHPSLFIYDKRTKILFFPHY